MSFCVNLAVERVRSSYLFSSHVWMFYRENRCGAALNGLCLRPECVFVCVCCEKDKKTKLGKDSGAFTAVPKTRGRQCEYTDAAFK